MSVMLKEGRISVEFADTSSYEHRCMQHGHKSHLLNPLQFDAAHLLLIHDLCVFVCSSVHKLQW